MDGLPGGTGQAPTFTRSSPPPPDAPAPTERLRFRRWCADDAPVILELYSRPEVYRFLGAQPRPVLDLDEARA
ncbi:MAG TPA: GNAT family N-acetyltransferase, partial [Thermoanaerobaculia bacterium]|nr:GNAT family N-acetyltransferase [Thermoanaerobaculia bacterium]